MCGIYNTAKTRETLRGWKRALCAWLVALLISPGWLPACSHAVASNTTAPSPNPVNLDLSSTNASLTAGRLAGSGPVDIKVGGTVLPVTSLTPLTPAERLAVYQVESTGTQAILLGAMGNAVGGSFTIGPRFSQFVSGLVIPQSVTAIDRSAALNLVGNLTNYGNLYTVTTNASVNSASVAALNILNQQGALISSILPNAGLSAGLSPVSNLSLSAINNIINAGMITSAGSLSLHAGGSIFNALPGGVTGFAPIIQAVNNVNLNAANIVNSGLISSLTNNINIASMVASNLVLNNAAGQLQALNGAININNLGLAGNLNTLISGGDFLSKELNAYSGKGTIDLNVNQLTGTLNLHAGEAHVTANTSDLLLGTLDISGDPNYYNTGGNVTLNSNLSFPGTDLAIVAAGDITGSLTSISTASSSGTGGTINMVAGAKFTSPPTTDSQVNNSSGAITISGGSTAGGQINLPNLTTLDSSTSKNNTTNKGNITLIAFSGSGANSGTINVPLAAITSGGSGNGHKDAPVTVYGNGPIDIGSVDTNSNGAGGTAGTIDIEVGQPGVSSNITFASGTQSGGSFTAPSTLSTTQGVTVGALTTHNASIVVESGGALTLTGDISAGTGTVGLSTNAGSNAGIAIGGNVTGGIVTIAADGAGAITETPSTLITGSKSVALSSGSGDIGTSSARVLTSADPLSANTAGNVYISDNSDFHLDASSAGSGKVFDVITSSGSTGNIVIAGDVAAATGTIGSIRLAADGNGTIRRSGNVTLTASEVALTSGSGVIGASGSRIQVSAANLQANTAGNGVYLTDDTSVSLSDSSVGAGKTFDLFTTGVNSDIAIAGQINASSTGTVKLVATGSITDQAAKVVTALSITVTGPNGIGGSGAPVLLSGDGSPSATSSSGDVYLSSATAVNSISGISAANGRTMSLTTTGSNLDITFNSNYTNTNGTILLNASGFIIDSGKKTLTAGDIGVTGASGVGTSGARILASASTLSGNSTGGDVYLQDNASVSLGDSSAGTGHTFDLLMNGSNLNIAIAGNVNASSSGTATLVATGAITDAAAKIVTASSVNLTGPNGIGLIGAHVLTAARNLLVTSSAGDVYVDDSAASVGLGAVTVSSGKVFSLTGAGTINVNGAVGGAGTTTLNATTLNVAPPVGDDFGSSGNAVLTNATTISLSVISGKTFITDSSVVNVSGTTGTLSLDDTASSSGNVIVGGTITTSSTASFMAGNGGVAVSALNAGGTVSATSGGAISITSGSATPSISLGNIAGKSISLTASGSGDLSLCCAIDTSSAVGGTVTLTANGGTINANGVNITTNGGDIRLASLNGITAGRLVTNGLSGSGGNVVLTSTSATITVAAISATGAAGGSGGSITVTSPDFKGTGVNLNGSSIDASSATGNGGTVEVSTSSADTFAVGGTLGANGVAGNILANGGVNGGRINLVASALPLVKINAGAVVEANGGSGSGGLILFALTNPGSGPLTVVNNGTIAAFNNADNSGIIGFYGAGQPIVVTDTSGTGINGTVHAGLSVNWGNLNTTTLALIPPIPSGTFTAKQLFIGNAINLPLPTPPVPAASGAPASSTVAIVAEALPSTGNLTSSTATSHDVTPTGGNGLLADTLSEEGTAEVQEIPEETQVASAGRPVRSFVTTTTELLHFRKDDGTIVEAMAGTVFRHPESRTLELQEGRMMVIPMTRELDIKAPFATIKAMPGDVLSAQGTIAGVVRIAVLAGKGTQVVLPNDAKIEVPPGMELVISSSQAGAEDMLASDGLERGAGQPVMTVGGVTVHSFQFNPRDMAMADPFLGNVKPAVTAKLAHALQAARRQVMESHPAPGGKMKPRLRIIGDGPAEFRIGEESASNYEPVVFIHSEVRSLGAAGVELLSGERSQHEGFGGVSPSGFYGLSSMKASSKHQLFTLDSGKAIIKYQGHTEFSEDRGGSIRIHQGDLLVSASRKTVVASGYCSVTIGPGTIALLSNHDGVFDVHNIRESNGGSMILYANGRSTAIPAGNEVMIGKDRQQLVNLAQGQLLGRRNSHVSPLGEACLLRSEVSLVSLLKRSALLSSLISSTAKEDMNLTSQILKMAACLWQTTASRGPYSQLLP